MKRIFVLIALLIISTILFAQDVTAPNMTDFLFTPTTVNVTSGHAYVNVTLTAIDDVSLDYSEISFISPSGRDTATTIISFSGGGGTEVATESMTILGHLEAGDWHLGYITIYDVAGNWQHYTRDNLEAMTPPRPTMLTVINTGENDITIPTLTDFSFSPTTVDVTSSPIAVEIIISVTDDLAGLDHATYYFNSPSGSHQVCKRIYFDAGTLSEICTTTVAIPQYIEDGVWTLTWIIVEDIVENKHMYLTGELTTMGISTTLTVVNDDEEDVTAPLLTDFHYSSSIVDISSGPVSLGITLSATDDLSGLKEVNIGLFSPSHIDTVLTEADFPVSGALSGTLTTNVIIPQYRETGECIETGEWHIYLNIGDCLGNWHGYSEITIASLGFPATLTVISTVDIVTDDIFPESYALLQNFPNPFNPRAVIGLHYAEGSNTVINIYNTQGVLVDQLINGFVEAGNYELTWDASEMPSGIYFCTMQIGNRIIATEKMVLIK